MKKILIILMGLALGVSSFGATGSFTVTATVVEALVFTVDPLGFGNIAAVTGAPKASTSTSNFALAGLNAATATITMTSTTGTVAGVPNNTTGHWVWSDVTGGRTGTASLDIAVAGVTSWNAVTLDLSGALTGTLDTNFTDTGAFSEVINLVAEYN